MEERLNTQRKKHRYLPLVLLETVCVLLVVLIIWIIRFTDQGLYDRVKGEYRRHFQQETIVSGTANGEENEEESDLTAVGAAKVEKLSLQSQNAPAATPVFVDNAFRVPVSGTVTSGFGGRSDPFSGASAVHKGLDIAAPGGTPIAAAAGGTVSYVGYDENGYGNYLTIRHGDSLKTLYGHCSEIAVQVGQKVSAGETIARVGSTGRSTGNHLHFEVRLDGIPVDPSWFLSL